MTTSYSGIANIQRSFSVNKTGNARLSWEIEHVYNGNARLQILGLSKSIAGLARLNVSQILTKTGIARLLVTKYASYNGIGRVIVTLTKSVTGVACITLTKSIAYGGVTRLEITQSINKSGNAKLYIAQPWLKEVKTIVPKLYISKTIAPEFVDVSVPIPKLLDIKNV